MSYQEFLASKERVVPISGIEVPRESLNAHLFPFQRDIVHWALARGTAAIWADCGMGKTIMQLSWADALPGKRLIVAPLAVGKQTEAEAAKFGIDAKYVRSQPELDGIYVTNYEMLHGFDPAEFDAIVLDESSIIKHKDGAFRNMLMRDWISVPYRLACTATPAPNDYTELGNHSEFLGVAPLHEMLAEYFVHDSAKTQDWRLKGHAEDRFWEWVASWAVMLRMPSDLGYSDDGFHLPPLRYHERVVRAETAAEGYLFPMEAATLQERIAARRATTEQRVAAAARDVNASDQPWIVWCGLNRESDALANAIPDAIEVRGSDSIEHKESALEAFSRGDVRVLVTKPSIAGHGMNWQHCNNVAFVGLSDSWEQYYQAVRRCWRFGQERDVNVYVYTADIEGAVVANIRRKESDATDMRSSMLEHMKDFSRRNIVAGSQQQEPFNYVEETVDGDGWVMHRGDSCEVLPTIDAESVHYSVFSPPFESLYTYSPTMRDLGNSRTSEQFAEHFAYIIGELYRVLIPGRLVSIHCMNLPTSKARDGYIGLRDFRGEIIRNFQAAGFIYHSEVCIWKDPVTAMQRTKALGLLHKQLKKDAAMSRQGIADYLVTMRKPGDNPEPVTNTNDTFPVKLWQKYASPVWSDINQSDTLQYRSAREHEDERHICPLQLPVIRRAIRLWSNPGDIVLSPFAGIGSEGVVSIEEGRRFIGVELKGSYYDQAVRNLEHAVSSKHDLFSQVG